MCATECVLCFPAQSDEGQSVCMCVEEGEEEGGCQLSAAKCRVTGGVFETERERAFQFLRKSSVAVN